MSKESIPTERTTADDLRESIEEAGRSVKKTVGDDQRPLDQEAPGSAFGLVALSYFIALALVVLVGGLIYVWTRGG